LNIHLISKREAQLTYLVAIWESAVRATHSFLTEADIKELVPEVKQGLLAIDTLLGVYEEQQLVGFLGIQNEKIEMLFIDNDYRGKGYGKKLIEAALENYVIHWVDVNEQNPEAFGFYQHMGFDIMQRSDMDEQGRPFPILHLKKA
jgi:ribosomal protein S18 acetylase RimI-like enzyme